MLERYFFLQPPAKKGRDPTYPSIHQLIMTNYSTHSTIHSRFKCFVDWLSPEEGTEEKIRKQADEIRNRISKKVSDDGLTVTSMPYSGSYAKNTGLRRHMHGDSEEEGQDVDIAFINKRKDSGGKEITELILRYEKYAKESYPDTTITTTKSSVCLDFVGTKLRYDLVPLLETSDKDRQELIRKNGERRLTSINKHVEFIKKRTADSNAKPGVVKFNECLRLVKWWCSVRQDNGRLLGKEDGQRNVPSFLLNLLCAKAYDEVGIQKTWADTLARWFGYLANVVRKRQTVSFTDYVKSGLPAPTGNWMVLDPVDYSNNIVLNWSGPEIDELASWLEQAWDLLSQALKFDYDGDDVNSLDRLTKLMGNAFKTHCK